MLGVGQTCKPSNPTPAVLQLLQQPWSLSHYCVCVKALAPSSSCCMPLLFPLLLLLLLQLLLLLIKLQHGSGVQLSDRKSLCSQKDAQKKCVWP
jgi:hypothetical protein